MASTKNAREKIPYVLPAIVRSNGTRRSRIEELLLEMQTAHPLTLQRIRRLREEVDELTATVTRRLM